MVTKERYAEYLAARCPKGSISPRDAQGALRQLNFQATFTLDLDWNNAGDLAELETTTPGGLKVKVIFRVKADDAGDDSDWLGEFSREPKPNDGADTRIKTRRLWPKLCRANPDDTVYRPELAKHGQSHYDRNQLSWWSAPFSRMETFRYYHNSGMNRHDAWRLATSQFWEQFKGAERYHYISMIICEVWFHGDKFAWNTVGGITMSDDTSFKEARAYLNETANDMLDETLREADVHADQLREALCPCATTTADNEP